VPLSPGHSSVGGPQSPGLPDCLSKTDAAIGVLSEIEFWGVLAKDDRSSSRTTRGPSSSTVEDDEPEEIVAGRLMGDLCRLPVLTVSVGATHVFFVTADWHAYAKGGNSRGQLGVGFKQSHYSSCQWLRNLPYSDGGGDRSLRASPSDFEDALEDALPRPLHRGFVSSVACGAYHSLVLVRGSNLLMATGAYEGLGCGVEEDSFQFTYLPALGSGGVTAFAARGGLSCCSVKDQGSSLVYFWGEGDLFSELALTPFAGLRVPGVVRRLGLGECFGLALNDLGDVYAWGDGTHAELGGASRLFIASPSYWRDPTLAVPVASIVDLSHLEAHIDGTMSLRGGSLALATSEESVIHLGNVPRQSSGSAGTPRIVDLACGAHHSLLLDDLGRVYSFGDNVTGQCGCVEQRKESFRSSCVTVPQLVKVPPLVQNDESKPSKASKVFAGSRHSGLITADRRLFMWGHPANRKLGHAGFNPDGTEAGEDPHKKRPPGVAARSPLRDAVRKPREVHFVTKRPLQTLGMGDECTFIVANVRTEDALPEAPHEPTSPLEATDLKVGTGTEGTGAQAVPTIPAIRLRMSM